MRRRILALGLVAVVAGCGGGDGPGAPGDGAPDDGAPDGVAAVDGATGDAPPPESCGDGVVDAAAGELCDTGIAGGAGACPTGCDDGDGCTTDVLTGSGCQAACSHGAITAFVSGDGCCPPGGDATLDGDCGAVCGNGVIEAGETCDGTCPTGCDDLQPCTADVLTGSAALCTALCTNSLITALVAGDGCCPAGATFAQDADCPATCGDGAVSPPETCDTGITLPAMGACPTACDDGDACTVDSLVSGGTCLAACAAAPITMPAGGDGCCPTGANANTDSDCPPRCGNGVIEGAEACDDGNTTSGDGCSAACQLEPTAFRMTDLDLRDPHVYVNVFGCRDLTNTGAFGVPSVNAQLQTAIQDDTMPADGRLDLSPVLVFRPLAQAAPSTPVTAMIADCSAPMSSTTCMAPAGGPPAPVTATNTAAGTCLPVLAGTTYATYTPAITVPAAPCFTTDPVVLTVTLAGAAITLVDTRVAATYSGNPATALVNGEMRGFISEAGADATTVMVPVLGAMPLSRLLPGGAGNCAGHDDRDTGPGGVRGWYFYFNGPAVRVPYSGP